MEIKIFGVTFVVIFLMWSIKLKKIEINFIKNVRIFINSLQNNENNKSPKTKKEQDTKTYDDRIFDDKKSGWLSLSADEQLDRILTSMKKKQIQRKYGNYYEKYDENDSLEIRDAKMFWNVSRLLRQQSKRR